MLRASLKKRHTSTLSPPLHPRLPSPHPDQPGAGASWASAGGSCASSQRWYHQLGWKGAEQSSRLMDREANACTVDVRARGSVPVEVVSRWNGLITRSRLRDAGQRRSGLGRIPSHDRLSPLHPRVLPKAGAHRGTDERPAL